MEFNPFEHPSNRVLYHKALNEFIAQLEEQLRELKEVRARTEKLMREDGQDYVSDTGKAYTRGTLTWKEAILKVLEESGEPLSTSDITEQAVKYYRGNVTSGAQASVSSNLSSMSKEGLVESEAADVGNKNLWFIPKNVENKEEAE